MANLRYPASAKHKAGVAWLGCIIAGFCPILYAHLGYYSKEANVGSQTRPTYGEPE
jgi:hypothetical protein